MFTIVSTTEHVYVIGLRTHLLGDVTLEGDQTYLFTNSHDHNLIIQGILKVGVSETVTVKQETDEKAFAQEVVEASKAEAVAEAPKVEAVTKEEVVEKAAPVADTKPEPIPEEPVVIVDAEAEAVVEVAPKKRR